MTTMQAQHAVDWSQASVCELIQHILDTHHVYLREHVPAIQERLTKILQKRPETICDFVNPLAQTFGALKAEIEAHMMKEEQILFPYLRALEISQNTGQAAPHACFDSVKAPILQMEAEHAGAKEALDAMRRITNNYFVEENGCPGRRALFDALQGLEADLRRHIQLEDEILFPKAIQLEAGA